MDYIFNDGGRKEAGFKGTTNDCVVRAIAIATKESYLNVYNSINNLAISERITKKKKKKSNARKGVYRQTYQKYLEMLGWKWTPTMLIGQGCKTHLKEDELPKGILIVSLSRHLSAVIDSTIHDIFNPSRNGTRCVYGYWQKI